VSAPPPGPGANASGTGASPGGPRARPALDATVRWLALAPVVSYLFFAASAAVLDAVLGPGASRLPFLVPVELLLGGAYVGLVAIDRGTLADGRWSPGRWWYLPAFVLGGTVLAAPLFVAAYFYRRRQRTGRPVDGWLRTLRRALGRS